MKAFCLRASATQGFHAEEGDHQRQGRRHQAKDHIGIMVERHAACPKYRQQQQHADRPYPELGIDDRQAGAE